MNELKLQKYKKKSSIKLLMDLFQILIKLIFNTLKTETKALILLQYN